MELDFFVKTEQRSSEKSQNFESSDLSNHRNSEGEGLTEGKWSDDENVKFVIFMVHHKSTFKSKEKRKAEKIFKTLSVFLQSRTPRQCRSHYQKLMKKFRTIPQMKKFFQSLIGEKNFTRRIEEISFELQALEKLENSKEESKQMKIEVSVQTDDSICNFFPDFHFPFSPFQCLYIPPEWRFSQTI